MFQLGFPTLDSDIERDTELVARKSITEYTHYFVLYDLLENDESAAFLPYVAASIYRK